MHSLKVPIAQYLPSAIKFGRLLLSVLTKLTYACMHTHTHNSATPGTQDITDPVYFVKVLAFRVNLSYADLLTIIMFN